MKYYNLCLFLIVVINITKSEKASYLKTKKYQEDDSKSSPAEPRTYKGYCFTKINNHFFDLNPLNSLKSYHLKTKDGQLINFNFCSNVETSCVNNEAMIVSKEECKRFSDVSNQEKTWSLIETPRKPSVLTVTLSEGDVCEKRNDKIIKYTTVFEITCDRTVDEIIIINDKEFDPKKCFNVIKIKSKYGTVDSNV
jgi:hypothetical protein